MFPLSGFFHVFFFGGGGSAKHTQRIFMICLVSHNMSFGGLIHSDVILKVLACPLVLKLVCKKASKFALENQLAVSKQIHQNCSVMCALLNVSVYHWIYVVNTNCGKCSSGLVLGTCPLCSLIISVCLEWDCVMGCSGGHWFDAMSGNVFRLFQ